ncbi:transposase (fragment) [Magnetospirillum molischianum DSM 120]|uniref:Transposase n=1 Tax=Magnetospirillum molischianum DSM 120 TaxID=1150626 RepID=H8FQ01_MAGML
MLPVHFPSWQTVYWWFRRFVRFLLFRTIHDVKAPMADKRGYDAGKKVVGRKRHIAVDTDGRLLAVNLTTADISDSAGAMPILDAIRKRWPWIKHSPLGRRAQYRMVDHPRPIIPTDDARYPRTHAERPFRPRISAR